MTWQTLDCTSEQDYEARLQTIIDWHHDTEFTDLDTKPGWRMTLLRRRTPCATDARIEPYVEVVFSWNHPNFDGMGGKIFHETLLANLNKTVLSDAGSQPPLKDHVLDLSSDCLTKDNFTPNLHDITKLPVTPGFTVKTAWKELKPAKKPSSPRSSSPSTSPEPASDKTQTHGASWCPIVADRPYKTHTLRSHALDGPALDKVLSLCRQQPNGGITLTALLHALCLSSMAPLFPIKTADGKGTLAAAPGSFDAATALNFRRFLKPSPPGYPDLKPSRTMANYVSALEHRFGPEIVAEVRKAEPAAAESSLLPLSDAAKQAIFHAADQIKQDLSARIDRGVKNDQAGLMALVGDWRAQHTANTKKPRHGAWNVSNIGVIDGDPTGDTHVDDADEHAKNAWRITKSWFTVGAMVTSGVFMVSPVAVKGQGLFLGCTWQDGIVDRKFAEQFFTRLDARLKDIAR